PMALVDPHGRVLQLNAAGRAVFGLTEPGGPGGTSLQELGLSSSEVAFRDVLSRASFQPPWHGRVVVTPESGDRRICDCTDLVRDVAEIRERVLRAENVEVRTRLDLSVPPVLGLGQDLQQVVINLVTNAEHAVRGPKPGVIQLTTQARAGWVRLTVEDSGPGVPKDIRGRIFDP